MDLTVTSSGVTRGNELPPENILHGIAAGFMTGEFKKKKPVIVMMRGEDHTSSQSIESAVMALMFLGADAQYTSGRKGDLSLYMVRHEDISGLPGAVIE